MQNFEPARRRSAAGLTVPGRTAVYPPTQTVGPLTRSAAERVVTPFLRLAKLNEGFGSAVNKNDRVMALIAACIESGINSRPHIIGTLTRLGFNNRHVALLLNQNTGAGSAAHWWSVDKEGIYTVLSS